MPLKPIISAHSLQYINTYYIYTPHHKTIRATSTNWSMKKRWITIYLRKIQSLYHNLLLYTYYIYSSHCHLALLVIIYISKGIALNRHGNIVATRHNNNINIVKHVFNVLKFFPSSSILLQYLPIYVRIYNSRIWDDCYANTNRLYD